MATGSNGSAAAPELKVIVRVFLYYAILITLGWITWRYLPRSQVLATTSLDTLFGQSSEVVKGSGKNAVYEPVPQDTLAATVAMAMLASALLALPIAWVYTLTRARRGYQQSVVQLLIILPVAVDGHRRAGEVQPSAGVRPRRHRGGGALPQHARRQQGRGLHLSHDRVGDRLRGRSPRRDDHLDPLQHPHSRALVHGLRSNAGGARGQGRRTTSPARARPGANRAPSSPVSTTKCSRT